MAVATFIGVFPLAMILQLTIGSVISEWPFVLRNAVFNQPDYAAAIAALRADAE